MKTLLNSFATNVHAVQKQKVQIIPQHYILKAKEEITMNANEQKKLETLKEEIAGLQRAVRRQAEDHTQALAVLSQVRNDVEIHKKRLESLELKTERINTAAQTF